MTTRDQNGEIVTRELRREVIDGRPLWGVTVWFGGGGVGGFATDIRRYYYRTRDQARDADIAHYPGQYGREQ